MAEEYGCSHRSLGGTLVAAGSTFALFLVTSCPTLRSTFGWNLPHFKGFLCEFLNIMLSLAVLPVTPFINTLVNVLYVYQLHQSVHLHLHYVSTMALCRIFIQLRPRAAHTEAGEEEEEPETFDKDRVYPHSYVESFDPLELCFGEDEKSSTHQTADYLELQSGSAAVEEGTALLSKMVARIVDAGVKQPAPYGRARLHEMQERIVQLYPEPKHGWLRFKEREALLLALEEPPEGLVRKLEFARDKGRSVLPNVVRAFQAVGYMWTVLERTVQHDAVSPVEAILTFLSLLVTLQMFIELYACARYSRVLVLRLSPQQYTQFFNLQKDHSRSLTSFHFKTANLSIALILSLVSAPFVYQAFSFRHRSNYLCFVSTFLFFLSPLLSSLGNWYYSIYFSHLQDRRSVPSFLKYLALPLFLAYPMSATSIVLAVVATVKNWKMFNTQSANILYSWILPHISS